ncbi:FkbM family methyltransferase [Methanoregula sp.]|uniref:FkbM family methyltransferase n=1 Tax=Methanoregula sp. TaxID=2052170 RepID=UPI003568DFFC
MTKSGAIVNNLSKKFFPTNPIKLVDIGASGGLNPNWQPFEESLEVIGFEPDPRAYKELAAADNKRIKYFNIGVHSEKNIIDFNLYRQQTASSIYKPKTALLKQFPRAERLEVIGLEKITVDSLDHILSDGPKTDVDFLKIDTDGNELAILNGAKNTLSEQIFGIELEVYFAQIRYEMPVFSDVDQYLRGHGFELFDIRRGYWKRAIGEKYGNDKGQLIVGDALYLKNIESFYQQVSEDHDASRRKEKIVKAISVCLIYGYYDYALQLLDHSASMFQSAEGEYIQSQLQSIIRNGRKIPNFRGRGRIAQFFMTMSRFIEHPTWAFGDQSLGN